MSFLDTQTRNLKAGNAAGFVLDFHKLAANGHVAESPSQSITSDNYFTKMDLTLAGGFTAGRYVFEIEGLTDELYATIAAGNPDRAKVIKLYLYWADVMSDLSSYLTNFVTAPGLPDANKPDALVAVLQIIRVSRTVGDGRYITRVDAIERVFYQARNTRTPSRDGILGYREAIQALCDTALIDVTMFPNSGPLTNSPAASGSEQYHFQTGDRISTSLKAIGNLLEEGTPQNNGRGQLLVRDGQLIVGVRPIPYPLASTTKDLLASNGLLKTELTSDEASDPFAEYSGDGATPPVTRPRYSLILKGRPDLKPGDVVRFDLSPENMGDVEPNVGGALLGPFAGAFGESETIQNEKFAYVDSVNHKFGREQGFYTTVVAIGMATGEGADAWDPRSPAPSGSDESASTSTSADPAERAAAAIGRLASSTTRRTGIEIGEVRSFVANSTEEPTSQTELVWSGLVDPDGRANQSRRLPISRQIRLIKEGLPYASPFAWGKCGLILPRYPGMRVALGFRNGASNDPVDLGGIFETGTTSTEANPGDYWLCLPADVPHSERSQISEDTVPSAYTGKVSNDLIDADGNRIIEAGEFTIRVAAPSELKEAGERPARPEDAGSITIHHTKNDAKIIINADGEITIQGKKITLDAGSGDIEMIAGKVDVSVSSEMNVH